MKALVACEYSGRVRRELERVGFEAWSCDLLPSEDESPRHIVGDVSAMLREPWDFVVAHPPCTRLANSGVRWLHERDLWSELDEAAAFFRQCLDANAPFLAVENPVMHKHALERVGRRHSCTVQPWQFGDAESKRTCFWTRNLPALKATHRKPEYIAQSVHKAPPSPDRWKERSRTFPGIAKAIANQWGRYVLQHPGLAA